MIGHALFMIFKSCLDLSKCGPSCHSLRVLVVSCWFQNFPPPTQPLFCWSVSPVVGCRYVRFSSGAHLKPSSAPTLLRGTLTSYDVGIRLKRPISTLKIILAVDFEGPIVGFWQWGLVRECREEDFQEGYVWKEDPLDVLWQKDLRWWRYGP